LSANLPLRADAVVGDTERPALVAAAKELGECLGAASGGAWPIELRFRESVSAIASSDLPTIVIASLLPEVVGEEEPWPQAEARWRQDLLSLRDRQIPAVFVCTIFRHVANRSVYPSIERIRRLNLLVAELSHDIGINVIDIDRVFAHIGAAALQTDYRVTGPAAVQAAANVIVSSVLAAGLDHIIPAAVQEEAKKKFQSFLRPVNALGAGRPRLRETDVGPNGSY
jgi:hypothetical protein